MADFTGSPLNARPISVPKKRSWLVQIVDGDVTAQDTALSPIYGEFPPKLPPITPSNGSTVAGEFLIGNLLLLSSGAIAIVFKTHPSRLCWKD